VRNLASTTRSWEDVGSELYNKYLEKLKYAPPISFIRGPGNNERYTKTRVGDLISRDCVLYKEGDVIEGDG
jgi:hypothetical protein